MDLAFAMTAKHPLATVLHYDAATNTWKSRRVDLLAQNMRLEETCYVFLEDGKFQDWYKEHCPQEDRRKILAPFQVPDFLSNQTSAALNGYFGCKASLKNESSANSGDSSSADTLETLVTWFRILTKKVRSAKEGLTKENKDYLWYEMDFFTRWNGANACRVLCINTPQEVYDAMSEFLTATPTPSLAFQDPFAMLLPLLDEVIKSCDKNTWSVTKEVRQVEKNRSASPEFEKLHNLLRHTNHVREVETVAIETMERLLARQKSNFEALPSGPDGLSKNYQNHAKEYLAFQLQIMKSLRARAGATQERLLAEINLTFNILATMDNQIMKSITLLTMIFLPATFVSAMFSTTFFSFKADGWQFSCMFWVYWVITVPLTVITVFAWWKWLGGSVKDVRSKLLGT